MIPGKYLTIGYIGLLGGMFLAACVAGQVTPLPTATTILDQSAQTMQSLQSTHFVIDRTGAPAYLDPNQSFIFRQAEGDYAAPDQARATVRVIGPAVVIDVRVIAVGEQYWETNPTNNTWGNYSGMGYNPAVIFDPETGLVALMRDHLTDLTLIGLESLEDIPGEEFYHLTAEAPGQPVLAMTADLVGRGRVSIDWWIQPETYYVTRIRLVEPETDPADPTVWVVDFDSFNDPVTIEPPVP